VQVVLFPSSLVHHWAMQGCRERDLCRLHVKLLDAIVGCCVALPSSDDTP
jgi:hypothetical protein